ncbi:C-5 cytosine methyltransferase [Dillenia turbinata]|uniref:DNA (cytosine-5-)-methyltransferase n=1 Tax=Dillenia turbinata TaxID=194707 RepID=A0AAN8VBC1_9MAGN
MYSTYMPCLACKTLNNSCKGGNSNHWDIKYEVQNQGMSCPVLASSVNSVKGISGCSTKDGSNANDLADTDSIDWDTEDELEIQGISHPSSTGRASAYEGFLACHKKDGEKVRKESDIIDWDSEDELEIKGLSIPPCSGSLKPGPCVTACKGEASSSACPYNTQAVTQFVNMGFHEHLVIKAIEENGEKDTEAILETLLTYSVLDKSPQESHVGTSKSCSSESGNYFLDDSSDDELSPQNEDQTNQLSEEREILSCLVDMGYSAEDVKIAMERCGSGVSMAELADFICAAQLGGDFDAQSTELSVDNEDSFPHQRQQNDDLSRHKKRKIWMSDRTKNRVWKKIEKKPVNEDKELTLPNPMVGFGLPDDSWAVVERRLPETAAGPPYFYYENVAFTPKGVWEKISKFLYDIKPEFVDSMFFSAAARKRGYIHNLPIHNRFRAQPIPPQTIQEVLPATKTWWPSWDSRTKLNCIQTAVASARLTERIRKAVEKCGDGTPTRDVQKYVMYECKKWNLVWVGRNKVAPLEPDEMEMLLGFPKNHTRGGGISRTDRYKALGNTFQVDTVAYHLSVLKDKFPGGINILSLFSGIGGAEVALHKLGIRLKNVVSVEISRTNREILRSWWEQTNQQGNLIEIADVQQVSTANLEQWMSSFGGFDLVIGGSPCNNLSGSNRRTRDGLEGEHSSLFYDYYRILDQLRTLMRGV